MKIVLFGVNYFIKGNLLILMLNDYYFRVNNHLVLVFHKWHLNVYKREL